MKIDNLNSILDSHKKWLNDEPDGIRANLTDADLTRADLTGANLTDAVLTRANLTGAVLTDAVLRGADLTRAVLRGAVLRGADLTRAVLTDAVLTGAVLTDAVLPENLKFTPDAKLLQKVAAAALASDVALAMNKWHTCDTTHCIAGWAIHLHPDGKRLETNSSPYLAGHMLLGDEAAGHFFDSNEDAREYLRHFLPNEQ